MRLHLVKRARKRPKRKKVARVKRVARVIRKAPNHLVVTEVAVL